MARIPRVSGGGTNRSGQGAFGNMCRGGRMFAPTKTWRRWHRHINVNQRRYALCSALAASAVPALIMAKGIRYSGGYSTRVLVLEEMMQREQCTFREYLVVCEERMRLGQWLRPVFCVSCSALKAFKLLFEGHLACKQAMPLTNKLVYLLLLTYTLCPRKNGPLSMFKNLQN